MTGSWLYPCCGHIVPPPKSCKAYYFETTVCGSSCCGPLCTL